jgi:hypothetical protein
LVAGSIPAEGAHTPTGGWDWGITLKIKPVFAAFALVSVLFVSACSASNGKPNESLTPSPSQSTNSADSVVIPTPSATPVAYEGEQKTYGDLLEALKAAYPAANWTQSSKAEDQVNNSEVSFRSKDSCGIYGYSSFQSALDNDFGSYGDFWTTLGNFGQLGTILIGAESCVEKTSAVIKYPVFGQPGADSKVLTASKEGINDCLSRLSACFLDEGVELPERRSNSFNKALTELDELAQARFCVDPYFSGGPGGLNSCDASTDHPGVKEGDMITEVSGDLDILTLAASSPSAQRFGKYMIYGDGWVLFIYGSTDAYKQTFVEMNKVIKGTLIARY